MRAMTRHYLLLLPGLRLGIFELFYVALISVLIGGSSLQVFVQRGMLHVLAIPTSIQNGQSCGC